MILAEREPASARVIAAVIFLVRFWIEPKMNTQEDMGNDESEDQGEEKG